MQFLIDHICVNSLGQSLHVLSRKYPCCRRSLVAITGGHWVYTALYPGSGTQPGRKNNPVAARHRPLPVLTREPSTFSIPEPAPLAPPVHNPDIPLSHMSEK
jgi:hypothetical protein